MSWKVFHFGGFFCFASDATYVPSLIPNGESGALSTFVKNSPVQKKYSSKIKWMGTFSRVGKYFHIGKKKILHRDLHVCQVSVRIEKVEENFPL